MQLQHCFFTAGLWRMNKGLITALDLCGMISTCFATAMTLCNKFPMISIMSLPVKHTRRSTSSARNQATWREAMHQENCVTRVFQGKNCVPIGHWYQDSLGGAY